MLLNYIVTSIEVNFLIKIFNFCCIDDLLTLYCCALLQHNVSREGDEDARCRKEYRQIKNTDSR